MVIYSVCNNPGGAWPWNTSSAWPPTFRTERRTKRSRTSAPARPPTRASSQPRDTCCAYGARRCNQANGAPSGCCRRRRRPARGDPRLDAAAGVASAFLLYLLVTGVP